MSKWTSYSVGQVARWQGGFAFPSSAFVEDGIPIVRMSDLKSGRLDLAACEKVPTAYHQQMRDFALRDGDFLMGMTGSLENYALVGSQDLPALLNQRVGRLVWKSDSVEKKFAILALLSEDFKRHAEKEAAGAAQKNISPSQIERFCFPCPIESSEQRRIAEILTTVDETMEQTEALVAKLQQMKAGLMHDLFARGVTPEGHLRPTQPEAPHLYHQTPLGWLPNEWGTATLGELSNSMTNGFVGTATPFYSDADDAVQYLYGNNVRPNMLELPTALRVARHFHDRQRKSQLEPGDMLTVQSGHIGTSAIVPPELGEANCHALIITKFKKSMVLPTFVSLYCNSPEGFCRLGSMFVGSTILHINVKEFKHFTIPLPFDLAEQEFIAERVASLQIQLDNGSNALAKLRQQKQGLMQDLLTGRVRVENEQQQ